MELAGGATAFVVHDPTLPLVDVAVVARAGAWADPPAAPGLAELTAALLRRGGTATLEPDRFDERLDELGAIVRSQATMLYGVATLRCTSDVLDEAAPLFLDMLERPGFDARRLAALKGNLRESMARRQLDPLAVLGREWEWLMFGAGHFSTRPLRAADLDALTAPALADFHRRHWRPASFWIAAGGDVDGEGLRSLFDARFRDWTAAVDPPSAAAWPPPPPAGGAAPGLYHVAADVPQAKVALGHRAPSPLPTVEERVRLEVMAEILGGRGAISRLNGRLRSAEGLVYRVAARLDPGDLWPADYRILFDTRDRDLPRALAAALEEIDRLRAAPPHPEELATVQRELLARRRQELDTAEEAAGYLVEDALVGRPEDYRVRYEELVAAVTAEDVLATARKHLRPDQLLILVAGRWQSLAGPADAAGWTELERLAGHRAHHLPDRDPLTLLPLDQP